MSESNSGQAPPAYPVNTTPKLRKPPQRFLDAAMRALPSAFNNTSDAPSFGITGSERVVVYESLCGTMEKNSHNRDATEWAIHEHIQAGRLVAEQGISQLPMLVFDGETFGGGTGRNTNRELCRLTSTPALWVWWDEIEIADSGSPLADLHREAVLRCVENRPPIEQAGSKITPSHLESDAQPNANDLSSTSFDPFSTLRRFDALRERVEPLASDFWKVRLPLRNALIAVSTGACSQPDKWVDLLIIAGTEIQKTGLADFPLEMQKRSPVGGNSQLELFAEQFTWSLLDAAARNDRDQVEKSNFGTDNSTQKGRGCICSASVNH